MILDFVLMFFQPYMWSCLNVQIGMGVHSLKAPKITKAIKFSPKVKSIKYAKCFANVDLKGTSYRCLLLFYFISPEQSILYSGELSFPFILQ